MFRKKLIFDTKIPPKYGFECFSKYYSLNGRTGKTDISAQLVHKLS